MSRCAFSEHCLLLPNVGPVKPDSGVKAYILWEYGSIHLLFYLYHCSVSASGRSTPGRFVGVHRSTGCSLICECLRHVITGCCVGPKPERFSLEQQSQGTVGAVWLAMCLNIERRDSFMGRWPIRSIPGSLLVMVLWNLTSTKLPYQCKDLYDPFGSKHANTLRVPICRCGKYETNCV